MLQRVDPFIPVRSRFPGQPLRRPVIRRAARSGSSRPARASRQARRPVIDGVINTQQPLRAVVAANPSPEKAASFRWPPKPAAVPTDTRPKPKIRRRRLVRLVRPPILIGAVIGCGLLLPSAVAGEALIGLYALFAIVRGVSSRTTFMLALAAIVVLIAALGLRADDAIGEHFAVYTFLLLATGTLLLGLEVRRGDTSGRY